MSILFHEHYEVLLSLNMYNVHLKCVMVSTKISLLYLIFYDSQKTQWHEYVKDCLLKRIKNEEETIFVLLIICGTDNFGQYEN